MSVPRRPWSPAELDVLRQHTNARAALEALSAAGLGRRTLSSVETKIESLRLQQARQQIEHPTQRLAASEEMAARLTAEVRQSQQPERKDDDN